jgi:hypothetical protein
MLKSECCLTSSTPRQIKEILNADKWKMSFRCDMCVEGSNDNYKLRLRYFSSIFTRSIRSFENQRAVLVTPHKNRLYRFNQICHYSSSGTEAQY